MFSNKYPPSKGRPQSAKLTKVSKLQQSEDKSYTMDENPRGMAKFSKKNYMLQGVSVSNNDLSRLMPKRIPQDKERLYQETITLKNTLNEVTEENHRLKTKVAILEKEREGVMRRGGRSGNLTGIGFKTDKENNIITNLKKMLRDTKEDNERLTSQLNKLKKTIRYTKLNEMEIEKQAIIEENKRQAKVNMILQAQLENRMSQQAEIEALNRDLKIQMNEVKQLTKDNMKYEEILEEVEMQNKGLQQRLLVQEKKLNRNNDIEKRKFEQLSRQNDRLKNEVNILHSEIETLKKKQSQQQRQRPASSHPEVKAQGNTVSDREKQAALIYNERLKKELNEAKQQLQESESRLKQTSSRPAALSQDEEIEFELTKNDTAGFTKMKGHNKKRDSYEPDFELTPQKDSRSNSVRTGNFNTKSLREVRELLTYRMKYHRYTFEELKADILDAPLGTFTHDDLLGMMQNEPFFLSESYAKDFLQACFGSRTARGELSAEAFIGCLRHIIEEFELLGQQQEEQMLYKIADFITKHRPALEQEFKRRFSNKLLNKNEVCQILGRYGELTAQQIDLTICYISITSANLLSINYHELLDKFFINSSHSNPSKHLIRSRQASSGRKEDDEDELSLGENKELEGDEPLFDDEMI